MVIHYQYSYLAEQYPNRIEWDIEKLLMVTIDIEADVRMDFLMSKMQ